ncbi:MAG: 2-5 ligase [Clostridiaceae bacterium]|jgi:RNA ligase (TIGR02306 family)|nr:2-5 ligase [Clostridiaceae bacterium]
MRKLASIQKITKLVPHFNADTLDIATILGWKCVVKKGQFKEGDLCIYFEIDSILPKIPEFEYMAINNYRLKTLRLRGQLSQGLCWTTDILPTSTEIFEGKDVTELLGVEKYEDEFPEEMIGVSRGYHPTIVSKTGEERVQSFPKLIDEFMGKKVAITTKIDGYSASYIKNNDDYHVCSHTHSLLKDENSVYWKMEKKYNIIEILKKAGNYSIQGEIAGPGIMKNKLGLKENELFVFRIFNNDTQSYLSPEELIDFCKKYGLKHVPMKLNVTFEFTLEELLELAKGVYESSNHQREGIVIIPMIPCYSEILCSNLSMKVINNDYLIKSKKIA